MVLDLNDFDPNLRETVERSLEPYKKVVSPELIDSWREEALVLLTHHPYSAALSQQIRRGDPPVIHHSTMNPKDGAAKNAPESSKRGGGR